MGGMKSVHAGWIWRDMTTRPFSPDVFFADRMMEQHPISIDDEVACEPKLEADGNYNNQTADPLAWIEWVENSSKQALSAPLGVTPPTCL